MPCPYCTRLNRESEHLQHALLEARREVEQWRRNALELLGACEKFRRDTAIAPLRDAPPLSLRSEHAPTEPAMAAE